MQEGMYRIDYEGPTGDRGWGILVFDSGKVWGIDNSNAHYDGDFEFNQETRVIDAKITAKYPKGAELVTGDSVTEDDFEVVFDISLPRSLHAPTKVSVPMMGQNIPVTITKVRDAPLAY